MKPLEKLVASVSELHKEEIVPVKNKVTVVRQMLLFPETQVKMFHHVSLGNYYESMTAALWGGELTNRVHVTRNGSSEEFDPDKLEGDDYSDDLFQEEGVPWEMQGEEEAGLIKPDLIDKKGRAIGESKACRTGHSCNLFDAQLHRYKEIQFLEQGSEIYFAFYRHNLMKVKSFQGTEEDLFREMADRTFFAIRLPFSAVLAMHEVGKQEARPDLFRRYNGSTFPWCTILRAPTLNYLLVDAKEVFKKLELNPRDYVFERYQSPKEFEIEGHAIRQFPILCIHDRNRGKWVKRFISENSDIQRRQEECKRRREEYDPRMDGCSDV